jgi:fructoselysine-6-P-deglycase FrlB-like protein
MARFVDVEIASQPAVWRKVADLATTVSLQLPAAGERVAVVGCGTSWFIGMAYAALRESAGQGVTDAFAASEFPAGREYDVIVAISRSGTTTEVAELLRTGAGHARKLAIIGVAETPIDAAADDRIVLDFADEQSVVQTRFATAVLALLRAQLGQDIEAIVVEAERALQLPLPTSALNAEQLTFLGRGWTVGLAHEAALKVREASQSWAESYPAMDYRHGPIAIAAPGRVVWAFGEIPAGLAEEVARTGADWIVSELDPQALLVLAQRVAVARGEQRGLDPDQPRHLTRSVVLP